MLLRGNGTPMFLLANVVDDIEMGITHVVRAEEHLPNTPKQQMLWEALGHEPPVWAHVPVLVNEQRKKLSKRRDKVALEQYRDEGYLADAMVNYLMTLGWAPPGDDEIVPWSEIEAAFRLEDVTHSPAFFDIKKLDAFNGEYIRAMPLDAFIERAAAGASRPTGTGTASRPSRRYIQERLRDVRRGAGQGRLPVRPADDPIDYDEASWAKAIRPEWAAPLLDDVDRGVRRRRRGTADALKAAVEAAMDRYGLKLGKAQAPVRVAVTGRSVGPPLFESLEVLGRDETLRRLRLASDASDRGDAG